MKYTCLIADDNMLERDALEMHIGKIDRLQIVASCADGLEADKVLSTQQVDIVFSDIDMPDMSGFGLLKSLKHPPVFIFITAHPEYAVESFDLDVVDFMVKPVTLERLIKATNKAIDYIEMKKVAVKKQDDPIQLDDDYFFIRESNILTKVKYNDVAYIESMGDFSRIYTITGKKHITLVSLKQLEIQLPDHTFMRIHKQHIVNYSHITAISSTDLTLNDHYNVPLGASFRQALIDKVVDKNIITRSKI